MFKDSLVFIGISQSLFAVLVLGTQKKVSVSDLILIGCLLAITIRFLTKILINYADYPITDISVGIIPLTFGPFLYLYTKYLTQGDPAFDKRDWLHFIPFAVFLLVSILFKGQLTFDTVEFFNKDGFLWIRIIFGLIFYASVLLYMIFTFIRLSNFRKSTALYLDQPNSEINLLWLNFVSFLFSALFISYIVIGGINALTFSNTLDLDLISNIGLIVLVYAISYFGIKQPFILKTVYHKNLKADLLKENGNNRKSRKPKDKSDEHVKALKLHMETDKPYLQPNLSLADLAQTMEMSKSELTSLLNDHMGVNFFSYVNQYRLKNVLQKLEDNSFDHLTILSIAYDSGFNSKSTFNSIFKQHTGLTPTEYRRKQSLQSSNK